MSIRTEAIIVAAVRTQPQLENVNGFVWQQQDADNTLPVLARTLVDLEYLSGRHETAHLRPGIWYGASNDMLTRVWFYTDAPGIAVLDVGNEPGDRVDSSAGTIVPERVDVWEVQDSPALAVGATWTLDEFNVPHGVNRGTIWAQNKSASALLLSAIWWYSAMGDLILDKLSAGMPPSVPAGAVANPPYPFLRWGSVNQLDTMAGAAVAALALDTQDSPPGRLHLAFLNSGPAALLALDLRIEAHWWS